MVIEDPVQFISPSKIEQVEKFLKDLWGIFDYKHDL
jgi:hypothetical protein